MICFASSMHLTLKQHRQYLSKSIVIDWRTDPQRRNQLRCHMAIVQETQHSQNNPANPDMIAKPEETLATGVTALFFVALM